MIRLAEVVEAFVPDLEAHYGDRLLPGHRNALSAIPRCRRKQGKFLFPQAALAAVFRGKWFQAMKARDWKVRAQLPKQWVVNCERLGNGEKALIYLGRYLYRGVLAEENILACEDGQVTFRYTENSGDPKTRILAGADFLWLLLQHVLPKGFRRTRDYGFLHRNCKRLIQRLHLLLRACLPKPKEKPSWCCKHCGGVVTLTVIPYPSVNGYVNAHRW